MKAYAYLRLKVRGKLAEMQKNCCTVVLMNANIIFMTECMVTSCEAKDRNTRTYLTY